MGMDFRDPSSLDSKPVVLPSSASRPRPSRRGVFSVATVISLRGAFDEFLGDVQVSLSSDRGDVVENDRFAEAWRLREADVTRHHVLEDLGPEILSGILRDLSRQIETRIVHGEQDAVDSETFIGA